MEFVERLSCLLGKQYVFKQKKNYYYNRYLNEYQTKKQVQEWLIAYFEDAVTVEEEF
jgi:hypothetical protein